jgi:nucleotide-binding universal stress UspA family protein
MMPFVVYANIKFKAMKTLLVATDFSKNSIHVLEYAIMFANRMDAAIHLIWVDNSSLEESLVDTIEEGLRIEKKNYLEKVVANHKSQVPGGKLEYHLKKGKVYQEIGKTARQLKADIVFAGTHGVTGFEQYWIGSNAYRIMTSAPCPVITVRGDYNFEGGITNILLPMDSSLETKQKLPFTVELAERFGATIHLLKVYNSPIGVIRKRIDGFGREAEKCLKDKNINYMLESVEATNVAASILEYSEKSSIDLIAIMTEQNITTANKFLGPYAQQLINGANVPVLSLRDREYN